MAIVPEVITTKADRAIILNEFLKNIVVPELLQLETEGFEIQIDGQPLTRYYGSLFAVIGDDISQRVAGLVGPKGQFPDR